MRGRARRGRSGTMSSNRPAHPRQQIPGVPVAFSAMSAFSFRRRCMIRYADTVSLGVFGVSPAAYVFSANGCYDPDVTSTGHQPLGFDQMMVFFNHYTVVKSTIRVTFLCSSTNTPISVAVAVQRSSSALASFQRVLECGDVVYSTSGAITGAGGPAATVLKHAVNVANFQSVPNVLNDDTLRGTAAANPASQMYYVLYIKGLATSDQSASADVEIDYDVIFTEPLQPAQSLETKTVQSLETKNPLWREGHPRIPLRLLPVGPSGIPPPAEKPEPSLAQMFGDTHLSNGWEDHEDSLVTIRTPPTDVVSDTSAGGSCSSS